MFSFNVSTSVVVDAPRAVVWDVLVSVDRWASWTSVLQHESGGLGVGARPRLRLDPPSGRGYAFRPEITVRDEARTLEWVGRTGPSGVFDGRHRFDLDELDVGATRVRNTERFSGLLAPLLRRVMVDPDEVRHGFDALNDDLRRAAEQRTLG